MTRKAFHCLLLAIPCLVFAYLIISYSVNVPWLDDIEVFVDFLSAYEKVESLQEKVELLLKPNNEHRMFHGKLVNLLTARLGSRLSIETDILISSLSVFGVLFLLLRNQLKLGWHILFLIPAALFLLQPQYHLTTLWAITSLQTQNVLFFGILALWLLVRHQKAGFTLGIGLLVYNSFTMSNGMFFFPVAAILLLLLLQKRFKRFFVLLFTFGLTVCSYFYGFEITANSNGFAFFKQNPLLSVFGFFAHLGASFDFTPTQSINIRLFICGIFGLLMFVVILLWVLKGYSLKSNLFSFLQERFASKQRLFLLGVILFLFANAAIIAILRPQFGMYVLIVGNYRLYTSLILVCSYICLVDLLEIQPKSWLFKSLFVFSVLFWVLSFLVYPPEVIERRKDLLVRAYNQKNNGIGLGAYHGTFLEKYIAESFQNLPATTPYQFPIEDIFDENDLKKIGALSTEGLTTKLHRKVENGNICLTNLSLKNEIGKNEGIFLVLKSASETYLYYQKRTFQDFIRRQSFSTCLVEGNFKPGTYHLFLLQKGNKQSKLYDTQVKIDLNLKHP
jgi:hypothetical protein